MTRAGAAALLLSRASGAQRADERPPLPLLALRGRPADRARGRPGRRRDRAAGRHRRHRGEPREPHQPRPDRGVGVAAHDGRRRRVLRGAAAGPSGRVRGRQRARDLRGRRGTRRHALGGRARRTRARAARGSSWPRARCPTASRTRARSDVVRRRVGGAPPGTSAARCTWGARRRRARVGRGRVPSRGGRTRGRPARGHERRLDALRGRHRPRLGGDVGGPHRGRRHQRGHVTVRPAVA